MQLYVGMPPEASEPPRQLKAFRKIDLDPGESRNVELRLDRRELETFDAVSGQWTLIPGEYGIMIGASSRDVRLEGRIAVD